MKVIGRFLEFSIRTDYILDSMGFYRMLGFAEAESGDIWKHKYAVLGDGELYIGLHEREFDSPSVSFVHPELASRALSMTDTGFNFNFMHLDEDVFNEISFRDRDGHSVTMLEARTFSANDGGESHSLCGNFFELSLPVQDTVRAAAFWAPIAPKVLDMREEPTVHMRFDVGGAPIGLTESIALKAPALCFQCHDKTALMARIEQCGLPYEKFPGYEGAFLALTAPEGTRLYIFGEDFLNNPQLRQG